MRSCAIEALEDRRLFAVDQIGIVAIPDTNARLEVAQVQQVLAQAASRARPGQVAAVVDREGTVLGIIGKAGGDPAEQATITTLAIQRARTAAAFQSTEDAFTTRTARFIIQNHFPQPVRNTPGGPLYGVEFSSFPGTDILAPELTLGSLGGISGDPGGVPLFLNGRQPVGGVGVAGDGKDVAPSAELRPILRSLRGTYGERSIPAKAFNGKEERDVDESVAVAASQGFMAAKKIRATRVFVNGLRFPFAASTRATSGTNQDFATVTGTGGSASLLAAPGAGLATATVVPGTPRIFNGSVADIPGTFRARMAAGTAGPQEPGPTPTPIAQVISSATASAAAVNLPAGRVDPDVGAAVTLNEADVMQIFTQAVNQAKITRGGIREPDGAAVQVHIVVVDRDGDVLGAFRMADGTNFSFDVAVQKARTAAFFSDDTHAVTSRAVGFMSQKFFPPGIEKSKVNGPLFRLQDKINVIVDDKGTPATSDDVPTLPQVTALPGTEVPNGITIFPGGVPLYKNGVFVGAIGVSGDGVDQDDLVAFAGTANFRPSDDIRSDHLAKENLVDFIAARSTLLASRAQLAIGPVPPGTDPDDPRFNGFDPATVRTRLAVGLNETRLPYVKFPRNPTEP
jgi:uncharacterized protein GlcG (DUF336 family)